MIRLLMLAVFVFGAQSSNSMSQLDTTKVGHKMHYSLYIQAGMLVTGEYERGMPNLSVSTVHGIRIKENMNIGLGIGYNYYASIRTMPIFISVARDILGRENKLFLEVNYGGSIVNKIVDSSYPRWKFEAYYGPMINPSLGYQVKTNGLRISFVAGYNFQRLKSQFTDSYLYSSSSIVPLNYTITTLQMDLNRMVFAVRIGWW